METVRAAGTNMETGRVDAWVQDRNTKSSLEKDGNSKNTWDQEGNN